MQISYLKILCPILLRLLYVLSFILTFLRSCVLLPRNPSSNILFWPYSSWPSPLSFSFSLPPFLSLPLSGKSHGFPEVEHHKAWSAGGSLPSFIFMLCLSSPLIGQDSVMWHFVSAWGKVARCIYAARTKTFSVCSVSHCRLFGIKWRILHFLRCVWQVTCASVICWQGRGSYIGVLVFK